jgi:ribonucleoside-triphosphate reductase (thioredoxin)
MNADVRPLVEAKLGRAGADAIPNDLSFSGWAFCNLCEINAAKLTSLADFLEVAHAATIIGTCQATYTSFPYLGWVSEVIAEREALLGIGMTGMMDAPQIALNPEYQRIVAEKVKEWNAEIAAMIGIRPAARTTCVKPSGTTSLELGCVASGHHAHHARRYIRRVTADELETVFQVFKAANPHMCVRKPDGKWVIEFPVQAPDGAIIKDDLPAIDFLDKVRSTQQNWVMTGTARADVSPQLAHNVSNTVQVKPNEWEKVAEYIWQNRQDFTGITLLSATGDKDFAFCPNEAIATEADEARWNQLVSNYKPVDYTAICEDEDGTNLSGELSCAGGACEVHF